MIRSMNGAPIFIGNNYEIWKVRMKTYLVLVGCGVWFLVVSRYTPPKKVNTIAQKEGSKKNNFNGHASYT
jgi:hypothetical protein